MGCIIGLGQVLKVEPGVNLRGADVGMTQQLLYATQVTARLQHMASKRVAQHVWMHGCRQSSLQAALAHTLPDGL